MRNFLGNSPISLLLSGQFEAFFLTVLYLLPALVIALSFHEAAHAWAANKMGDPTAKNLGRLTLDPTKHFHLWGIIAFLFIGFGWGKPVPTNPRNYINYKKGNVFVALAGVTTNLILSFIFYFIFFLLYYAFGVYNTIILTIISYIIYMNIFLCFFNLIPIPPLDGHHLVKGFIARKSPRFYMAYERYGFFVLLILLFMTDYIQIGLSYVASWVLTLYSLFFGLFI
ncbi:MAG: site-2 protease family protein [Eubacteriales bacterium]|nr:site-2 protease family protein [Eubacteriales bacterium]